ncbi:MULTISPECIES: class I SAM-dependent methyltransferase [unclassified Schlesneria]|uniref:class I SAM-dependent methyltransferase n=1 Tax=Schlesneria TaxID=656899 RepID=UPI002F1828E8
MQIIDVGGTRNYWNLVPPEVMEQYNIFVTVINFKSESFEPTSRIQFIQGDGCSLPDFGDKKFDIVHSNSVIEHVGTWKNMTQYANEVRRIAPRYWVQTPYFWFPIEPHNMTPFYHWLPFSLRVKLNMRFNLGNWTRSKTIDNAVRTAESSRLLDCAMLKELFPDAKRRVERVMLLPKSIIMVR